MAFRWILQLGDKYAPVLKSSRFKQEGKLTPDEFLVAGEQLVHSCGTWSWQAGDSKRRRDYLPDDRQFLITRNVPCRRSEQRETFESFAATEEANAEWVVTHDASSEAPASSGAPLDADDVPDADAALQQNAVEVVGNDDDIPDADDFLATQDLVVDDSAALEPVVSRATAEEEAAPSRLERHRTYDVSITYDNWYKTPRVWLLGYDENGAPLSRQQMLEDISSDHAHKTATFEAHPHLGAKWISIHPCQHAAVMKKFIDTIESNGGEIRVDQYMFLFLKFVSAAVPTINYDFTLEFDGLRLTPDAPPADIATDAPPPPSAAAGDA